jgi:hypothetical protein
MTAPAGRGGGNWKIGFVTVAAAAAVALAASTAFAASRYDPRLRFRTIRTPHFDIHAHQGEEAMARRLAGIVERVRLRFEPVFGVARGRVEVILVDQTDQSNGWATPVPYDTIEITAVPPASESLLGNTTDWLELVFTHEYTHILHLDRTRGFMEAVRTIFGRVPIAFPNSYLPIWQIEGIATFEESRMTGEGRVPAGDFRAIVDVAAAHGRFESIDRASGGLDDWPGGLAAYAYGAYFHQYLADTYGPERLSRLADATAGRLPLTGAGAFKKIFGRSASNLWQDFRDARKHAGTARSETDARAIRLTHHGFVVTAPTLARDGTLYYETANADGFPALMTLPPGGAPRRVAWRVFGSRTAVRGDWIVFDQLERVRSVALYSDLYAVRTNGGDVRRLTREARAADPDLSPDRRRIVCTEQAAGHRALAILDFDPRGVAEPTRILDDPESDYTGPRWSPDGRQIVAARRRNGAYELVLIDPGAKTVRTILARGDARLVTPSWTPDGTTILFGADVGGAPFNIYAVDAAGAAVRQITDTTGGAQFPELSPSGTLTYVGYTPDGSDLFSIETDPTHWTLVDFRSSAEVEPNLQHLDDAENAENGDRRYAPWRTLRPTFWEPVIRSDAGQPVVGAGTAMTDALGRHAYAVDAGWASGRGRPDWHLAYAYDRWRATLFANFSDETDPIRGGEFRSRELFAGALLPVRHVRWAETFLAGVDAETDTVTCAAACGDHHRDLRSVRLGWLHDSRRVFGYSISPEEGFAAETAVELNPSALGSDAGAGAAILDARAFRRVFGRHTVIAARVAAASAWGSSETRRVFSAAGSGPSQPLFDFGRSTIGLLRGFAIDDVTGSLAAVANVDLRVPLVRVERGPASWPVFVRSIHAAAFFDAGDAWDNAFRAADVRTAGGGELSFDVVLLHYFPFTLVSGAAWIHDPVAVRSAPSLFGRIGYAF